MRMSDLNKDTAKIVEELKLCSDFKTFYSDNKEYIASETLSQMLNNFAMEKGLTKAEIIKNSEMSEVYGYQIFSGLRIPERKKLLCLIIGMGLSIGETQRLLKCAGYSPLYVKLPFDCIILYGICKKLSVIEINGLLFEYGLETLG